MAMYDDFEDEDTRRQRRDAPVENISSTPNPPARSPDDPYYTQPQQPGIGTPESGFGWGGVENPAYLGRPRSQSGDDVFRGNLKSAPPIATPQPSPGPGPAPAGPQQPSFQSPVAPPPPPQVSMQTPPITDEVTKLLMARLNELKNPGDVMSDPLYQQSVRAYQIGQLRSADKQRKALAERTAATSGTTSSGGFNVGVRGINERAGENSAQYRSGLAMDRLQARESQLNEAIKMARAVGQDDIANQLEVQRLALQQELGRGDLALRSELGRGQLGLGYDNLGFSYADLIARENRAATIEGMRG